MSKQKFKPKECFACHLYFPAFHFNTIRNDGNEVEICLNWMPDRHSNIKLARDPAIPEIDYDSNSESSGNYSPTRKSFW